MLYGILCVESGFGDEKIVLRQKCSFDFEQEEFEMVKPNKKEYDYIVSLGGSCNVATQLRHRGLRKCSFPLDWTLMADEKPIRWLLSGLRSRFGNFCLRENMHAFELPAEEYGTRKQRLQDDVTGFRFIHHFSADPKDKVAFDKERLVIQRRIERFYELINASKHVLFVLGTVFSYDFTLAAELYKSLAESFPQVDVELICVQFSASTCSEVDLLGGKLHIMTCERPVNIVYDNQLTAPEWCWMDQLSLSGCPPAAELRKKNILIKWKYKLWMWLGKSLHSQGAGCANMRFRQWDRYQ